MPIAFFDEYLAALKADIDLLDRRVLQQALDLMFKVYQAGGQIFFFGNGGSASTATHAAADFAKWTITEGKPRVRALSLSANMAAVTAFGNDVSYDAIFVEQLKNLLRPGDLAVGISASGNSPNVLEAIRYARDHGGRTMGWIGFGGGKLAGMVDVAIGLDDRSYGRAEDVHMILDHVLVEALRQRIAES
ncbi:MAG: SIS domain-containing protein [Candidatus Sumerlaeota bacterium]|nr:SIS domain-containing protein [Candidatus Sumerlaeota bacterium]